jgi:single-stranded DNA-binding protein
MKFLNSVLIEGTIADEPNILIKNNVVLSTFFIDSGTDARSIPIVSYGALVRKNHDLLHKGHTVRIVGTINRRTDKRSHSNTSGLHIVAEYMEFRPQTCKAVSHG